MRRLGGWKMDELQGLMAGKLGRMAKGLAIAFSCVRYNMFGVVHYEIDTHSTGTDQTDQKMIFAI